MLDLLRKYWRDILDVLILASLFYYLFRFIRGTRAAQMFVGLLIIVFASIGAGLLQLDGLNWMISSLRTVWVLAFLIIFQPELRKALTSLGGGKVFSSFTRGRESSILGELVRAVEGLSEKHLGGLVVIERTVGLKNIVETGTLLEGRVSAELLMTIFTPPSPLHDGAVVISGTQVVAAGCILPLSQNPRLAYALGTRHRAALGISEESDAIAVVVSEETAQISIAEGGRLIPNLDPGTLRSTLATLFKARPQPQPPTENEARPEEAAART